MSPDQRGNTEFQYKKKQAWAAFHKHKKVLLNSEICLQKRLQYFECCVNPTILFGLVVFPMTNKMLREMDILQRKMLRSIVGWRRISTESWEDTMLKMKRRIQRTRILYN